MLDTDEDKALTSLVACLITTKAILPSSPPSPSPPPPAILHREFLNLLTLLSSSATKVTLALNASPPAWRATVPVARELHTHLAALSHCAALFHPAGPLKREIHDVRGRVMKAAQIMIKAFVDGEQAMDKVAVLNSITDRALASMSKTDAEAAKKVLLAHRRTLEDGLVELEELIAQDGKQDDGDDDGWEEDEDEDGDEDELDLGGSEKWSEEEMARAKTVQSILQSTILFHKRLRLHLPSTNLDALLDRSAQLSPAVDELIASLYAPQDAEEIQDEARALEELVKGLREDEGEDSLVGKMEKLGVDAQGDWFATCIAHISRNIKALS